MPILKICWQFLFFQAINDQINMIKLSPIDKYKQDLTKDDFIFDAAQENAVKNLQRLYEELQVKPLKVSSFTKVLNRWKKVYAKPEIKPIKGLYFWGGVGRSLDVIAACTACTFLLP